MKKTIALLLALVMVLSLAACGSSDGNDAAATDAPASSDEKVKINMWCIATESDSNRPSYEKSIADFQAAHPEVEFTWEATENEAYKTKIKAAVSANDMPDIFFTWSCAFLGDFVNAGRVYCVDDVYAKYASQLPEVMMGNVTYDGKKYGCPLTMNIVGMFANMDILAQVGYTAVPTTYDDLIKCCDALVAKGLIPFGCAGKETWCVTEYLESIIEKTAGATALNGIFVRGDSWNNADVSKAVGIFQDMIAKNYFDPDGIGLTNDEIKNNFMNGKYAFYMNGTWNCADFAKKEGLNVVVSEFPVIDSSKSQLGELIGGPSDTLAVAAGSPNAAKAAEYCFEIGRGICKYGYLDGCGLPAWTPDYDTSAINALTNSVSDICAKASQYVLFGDTAMSAEKAAIYLEYVAKIYASEISGEDFVNGLVQEIN